MAKKKNINPLILSKTYMMERLLERITLSEYRNNFILKGGLLIASFVGLDTRSTVDMDTTLKGLRLDEEKIQQVMQKIFKVDCDDNIHFTMKNIQSIHEDGDYPGIRVGIEATIDRMVTPIKIDITTGDKITPKEIEYQYPLMFGDQTIRLLTYNIETVLAEKYESILSRGEANTRMRDFYDIYILTKIHSERIDHFVLADAIYSTMQARSTEHLLENKDKIIQIVGQSQKLKDLWSRYQTAFPYSQNLSWENVSDSIQELSKNIKDVSLDYENSWDLE